MRGRGPRFADFGATRCRPGRPLTRVGVIWNRNSHRNRARGGRLPLPDDVIDVVPQDEGDLFAGLRHMASEGVELVVIDGGDGTIREVLTRMPEAFGGRFPRLGLVPNGKTNALALDLGVPTTTTLQQVVSAARAGKPTLRRHCLEILRPGQALPERRGFIFGFGAFVRGTELAQKNHSVGLIDSAAVGVTLAGAALKTLFGGPEEPWRRGQSARHLGETRDWFLILASTLERLPLGVAPFGPPRAGLKLLSVEAPPRRLLRALPAILAGRTDPWLAEDGYRRDDLTLCEMSFDSAFILDGEAFEGGGLSLRQGEALEFVVP